jgi:hypothetical protein
MRGGLHNLGLRDLNRDTTLTELHLQPDASLSGTVGQILKCQ